MKHLIHKAQTLDTLARAALVTLLILTTYIIIVCVVFPMFMGERTFFSDTLLDFSEPEHIHLNLIAAMISMGIGAAAAISTSPRAQECPERRRLLTNVLSVDEQQIMAVVKEAGEITQDSLTYRLGWSRPKISTIITNLERMNLLQRKREGKTYTVFASATSTASKTHKP